MTTYTPLAAKYDIKRELVRQSIAGLESQRATLAQLRLTALSLLAQLDRAESGSDAAVSLAKALNGLQDVISALGGIRPLPYRF